MEDKKRQTSLKQISTDSLSLPKSGNQPSIDSINIEPESRKKDRLDLAYVVESLSDIIDSSGTISRQLIITDEEGYVLYQLNITSDTGLDIEEGCCMAVTSSGKNAMGLALANQKAVKVKGEDHSLPTFKHCISMGIPILYENRLIGCAGYILPAETLSAVQSGILDNVIRASLQAAAKMLEARKSLDELHLLKRFFNNLDNSKCNMIVNVNLSIVQLNRQAEIFLGLSKDDLLEHSLDKIIDDLPTNVFSNEMGRNYDGQAIMYTPSGKKPVLAHISPVYSDGDRLVGWHICFDLAISESPVEGETLPKKYELRDIIGKNKQFIKLLGLANAVAKSPSNVLITGESGTGKELFAQAIHNASFCADGPFVAINCAAIPKELIETELFGYVEGAFTGARKKGMQGKFQLAHGGSIFLDEIGDMPLELQSKLLRVLQERTVMPVGGSKPIPVNIRVISATNQKLEQLIALNKFRADLFYRLNVINLRLPPLRERKDDIPLLVQHFLHTLNRKLHKSVLGISNEAIDYLASYDWPGNIRQLENAMETAVNLADDLIDVEHLSFLPQGEIRPAAVNVSSDGQVVSTLEEVEKIEITRALNQCNGNVSQAAMALNIGRATLYRKIKKYKILANICPQE